MIEAKLVAELDEARRISRTVGNSVAEAAAEAGNASAKAIAGLRSEVASLRDALSQEVARRKEAAGQGEMCLGGMNQTVVWCQNLFF